MQQSNHIAPHIQRIIDESLQLYCDWINQRNADAPLTEHRFQPSDFTGPEDYRYARLIAVTPADHYNANEIITLAVHDGDEGGPHLLIITTDATFDDPPTVNSIIQMFDTMAALVYTDHGLAD